MSMNPGLGNLETLPLEVRRQIWQEFKSVPREMWNARPGGIQKYIERHRARYPRKLSLEEESYNCFIPLASRALYWEVSTELDRNRDLEIHICKPIIRSTDCDWVVSVLDGPETPWLDVCWERFNKIMICIHKHNFWSYIRHEEADPKLRDFEEELNHVVNGINLAKMPNLFHEKTGKKFKLEICIQPELFIPQDIHHPLWAPFLDSIFSVIRNIHGLEGFAFRIPKDGVSIRECLRPLADPPDLSGEREKELLRSAWRTDIEAISEPSERPKEHQFTVRIP
ncbi:MAG: hypothetical protein Q9222_006603 [Ikaeria aurantiellina]